MIVTSIAARVAMEVKFGSNILAKKHVNDGSRSKRSSGSQSKSASRRPSGGRERNIGHKSGEEHSVTRKGNPGQYKGR